MRAINEATGRAPQSKRPLADIVAFAFACEPGRGSEPGVGFAFVRALAMTARDTGRSVTVMTRPHRIDAIRDALAAESLGECVRIVPVGLPRIVVRATGRRHVRFAYLLWQWRAVTVVRRLIDSSGRPTIVHHITFATEAIPTFEFRLRHRAALVFGPAGSAHSVDREPLTRRNAAGKLRRALRTVLSRSNVHRSDLLIAANDAASIAWARRSGPVVVEPNIIVEAVEAELAQEQPDRDNKIIWIGGLIERKRPELALEALAAMDDDTAAVTLTLVGGGPLRTMREARAAELGVVEQVRFTGGVSRDVVLDELRRHHVLLHTSSQEGSSWVVGEAQAYGVIPVVIADAGSDTAVRLAAVGEVVSDACPSVIAEGLRRAIASPKPRPTTRWSVERLPLTLHGWYLALDSIAARRAEGEKAGCK